MSAEHVPVMVDEVLGALPLRPGSLAVDGTLGLAGHALRIAEKVSPGGTLVGIDWDEEMLEMARQRLSCVADVTLELVHADYRAIPEVLRGRQADGILLDLGLNNAQIEDAQRGISFRTDAPLDMRMDRSSGEPASAWINRVGPQEIERVLWEYADERWARKIAQIIVDRRKEHPIQTTFDLVRMIEAAIPPSKRDKRIHFATRSFQAIRIHVNGELDGLEDCITAAARCLAPGGVIAVLAYHSGEDRAVKRAFRSLGEQDDFEELTRKPTVPSAAEVELNPKSRSAKLRTLRRIP